MDNPQYFVGIYLSMELWDCFKPYYKWITLNTKMF